MSHPDCRRARLSRTMHSVNSEEGLGQGDRIRCVARVPRARA